jgi:hypothetical protein
VKKIDVIADGTHQALPGNAVLTITTIVIIEEILEVVKNKKKTREKSEAGETSVMKKENTSLGENRGNLLKKGVLLGGTIVLIELTKKFPLVRKEEEDLVIGTVRRRIGVGLKIGKRGEGMKRMSVASPQKRRKKRTTGGEMKSKGTKRLIEETSLR